MRNSLLVFSLCLVIASPAFVEGLSVPNRGDSELAKQYGADEHGMRHYILVVLKTGPHRVPDVIERDAMFKGHFANMGRLASEGKLVVAGPFGDSNDWRGMFVFAVGTPEEAEARVATDPVIKSGEMIAEYHKLYASAALMSINALHEKLSPPERESKP